MTNKKSLLKLDKIPITDQIYVVNPSVSTVLDDERGYYQRASLLTSTPYGMRVQLDDKGIDCDKVSEFELFTWIIKGWTTEDLINILDGVNPEKLEFYTRGENHEPVLYDPESHVMIDAQISALIADTLRKINGFTKVVGHVGAEASRAYLMEVERDRLEREAKKPYKPFLEELVIAMVNNRDFPYDYDGALAQSLFRFNASVPQIQKLKIYEQTMAGLYAGTIDGKRIDMKEINWI